MRTYMPSITAIERKWFVIDAQNKILGRLATKVANLLIGKGKPHFTPHLDVGDFVIVLNADKVILSGKKQNTKTYYHYSGYPGGLKSVVFSKYLKEKPEQLFSEMQYGACFLKTSWEERCSLSFSYTEENNIGTKLRSRSR